MKKLLFLTVLISAIGVLSTNAQSITAKSPSVTLSLGKSISEIKFIKPEVLATATRGFVKVKEHTIVLEGIVTNTAGVSSLKINDEVIVIEDDGYFATSYTLDFGINNIVFEIEDNKHRKTQKTYRIEREKSEAASVDERIVSYLNGKKFYALLIGVNDYQDMTINSLSQPVSDAKKFSKVLQENYTFDAENITVLESPTRTDIIEAFDKLAHEINEEDNLLVFYAGHGIWDEKLEQGYWLPSDAKQDSKAAWLSNGTIRDYIGGIKSKNTLLVADACFSGGIFKTRGINTQYRGILQLYKLPSRKAMTSGNMATVPDKSVFMKYLVKRLRENKEKYINSSKLFESFKEAVINNSTISASIPQYGTVQNAGDEGGDFIFVQRDF